MGYLRIAGAGKSATSTQRADVEPATPECGQMSFDATAPSGLPCKTAPLAAIGFHALVIILEPTKNASDQRLGRSIVSWYDIFKFMHVLTAVAWVGGGLVIFVLGISAQRRDDPVVLGSGPIKGIHRTTAF